MEAPVTFARTIFIGDVHGMLDTLDALLERLELTSDDRLIFLGDLVDKGPDPVGVVRRVGDLVRNGPARTFLLRGNHEDKHLRFYGHLRARPKVARDMAEMSPHLNAFHTMATEQDWQVLLSALPFWHDPEQNVLAVHGGIPGNMESFPFDWNTVETLPPSEQNRIKKIWLTRYVDRNTGAFIANGRQTPDDPFWASVYDGRFGHVIFGHEVLMNGPVHFPHATGIDTGAVHGGTLTALVLASDGSRETLSVPGHQAWDDVSADD